VLKVLVQKNQDDIHDSVFNVSMEQWGYKITDYMQLLGKPPDQEVLTC